MLADGLKQLLHRPELTTQAEALGVMIRGRDPVKAVVDLLPRLAAPSP